jgi:hypothetical protein
VTVRVTPFYEDGEFVVSGTTDEAEARAAVLEWLRTDDEAATGEEDEAYRQDRVDGLVVHRSGWFRWNPCSPRSCYDGGGHSGHLGYSDGPGRGRWQGVYLR